MSSKLQRFSFLLPWLIAAFFLYRWNRDGWPYYLIPAVLWLGFGLAWMAGRLPSKAKLVIFNIGALLAILDIIAGKIDLPRLAVEFKHADYRYILPAAFFMVLSLFLRALRWRWMLIPNYPNVRLNSLMGAICVGMTTNVVIPARVGEFVRAIYLKRREEIPISAGFASVVVERLLDAFVLLGFLMISIVALGLKDPKTRLILGYGFPVVIGGIVFFVFWIRHQERVAQRFRRYLPEAPAEKLIGLMESLLTGVDFMRGGKGTLYIIMYSLLSWGVVIFNVEMVIAAFGFGVDFPWVTPVLVLSMLAFSLAVPVTPGGMGVFQGAAMYALALSAGMEIDQLGREKALAFGFLLQLVQGVPILALGIYYLMAGGMSLKALTEAEEIAEESPGK